MATQRRRRRAPLAPAHMVHVPTPTQAQRHTLCCKPFEHRQVLLDKAIVRLQRQDCGSHDARPVSRGRQGCHDTAKPKQVGDPEGPTNRHTIRSTLHSHRAHALSSASLRALSKSFSSVASQNCSPTAPKHVPPHTTRARSAWPAQTHAQVRHTQAAVPKASLQHVKEPAQGRCTADHVCVEPARP